MSRAAAARPASQGAGATLAMVVILLVLVAMLPLIIPVAFVLFLVRSREYLPRFIHWAGRKRGKAWAQ